MPITITCTCGKTLTLPNEAAGQKGKCPECGAIINVPAAATPPTEMQIGHKPLEMPKAPTVRPFIEEVALAFRYPVNTRGIIAILVGSLVVTMLLPFGLGLLTWPFLIFAFGYLSAYFLSVVQYAAGGDPKVPPLPDMRELMDEIVKPFFWMLAAVLFSILPQVLYTLILAGASGGRFPAAVWNASAHADPYVLILLSIWSAVYFPMAVMSVAIWRNVTAVSPHIVIPTIFKIPGQHLLMSLMVWLIWQGHGYASARVTRMLAGGGTGSGNVFLVLFGISVVLLYFVCVIGRVIGITHYLYRDRIGWFPDRK